MGFFYSKTTNTFFHDTVNNVMPSDVVAIADELHTAILFGQEKGNKWAPDPVTGLPISVIAVVVPPSLAQLTMKQMRGGLVFQSTSAPVLNGTYSTDDVTQNHLQAELVSIMLNNHFADSTDTVIWLDMSNQPHVFNIAQFKQLATAIGSFVAMSIKTANGLYNVLPSNVIVVA